VKLQLRTEVMMMCWLDRPVTHLRVKMGMEL